MGHDMLSDIKKTVEVPLPPQVAFDLFTKDIASWWPTASHSLSAQDGETPKDITVKPGIGGEIFETKKDGSKAPWARITVWEPGHKIACDWFVGRDEAEATKVLVVFTPSARGTVLHLTHSGFNVLDSEAQAIKGQYHSGWDIVLAPYVARATGMIAFA